MTSRLYRWREERNSIRREAIATLLGVSVDDLAQLETGGIVDGPNKLALELLFDERLTLGQILSSKVVEEEEAIQAEMDAAFRRTCERWRGQ